MPPSLLPSLLTLSLQSASTFPAKGTKGKFTAVGTSQACSSADLPARVAGLFPTPGICQKRLSTSSGGSIIMEKTLLVQAQLLSGLLCLSYAVCSSSPPVRTATTSAAGYGECVCEHTARKRQFGMLLFTQHCVNSGNWTMG